MIPSSDILPKHLLVALTNQLQDAVFAIENGRFIFFNKQLMDILGYSEEEILSRSVFDFVHEEDKAMVAERYKARVYGEDVPREYFFRLVTKNGAIRDINMRVGTHRNDDGTVISIGSLQDLTENRNTMRDLSNSKADIESILNNIPDVFYRTDMQGIVRLMSPSIVDTLGYQPEEMLGKPLADFYYSPEEREKILRALAEGNGKARQVEACLRRKDGSRAWISTNAYIRLDSKMEPICVEGIARNITERKQMEEILRRSQKMDAVGQLTGGIAHDFNNILGIIIGNVDFLKRLVVQDDKAIKRIETISKAALRAADLTKQLLGFSRRQAQNMVVTNINQVVQGMDSLIIRSVTPEVAVEHCLAKDLWLTEIDPGDFENALLNLILNARDAMPEGGRLIVETSNEVLDITSIDMDSAVSPGEYVQLAVSDTGSGIAPEIIDRIFEPFFTTKPQGKGTGLGLSMVFGFAERSNGYIKAYSDKGAGTTIRLHLPRSKRLSRESDLYLNEEEKLPHGGESILVVDDEEELLELAEVNLRELGYTVYTAMNGQQALDLLNENRQIDLLFSDVVMPGGMNGYELAEQAAENRSGLKVLLTSGFTSKVVAAKDQVSFSANLLTKPYTLTRLAKRVRFVLDE